MTVTLHKNIGQAEGHGILSALGPYADATARRAAVVTAAHVAAGVVCKQTDTGDLYYLASQSAGVPTWVKFTTEEDSVGGGAINWVDYFTGAYQILQPELDSPSTGAAVSLLTDRSSSGKNATATSTARPLFTTGLSGCAGVAGDGVDDYMTTTGLNLPAPGTTPYYVFAVCRFLTATTATALFGSGDFNYANSFYAYSSTQVAQKNASEIIAAGVTPTNWGILEIKRSNSSGDTIKFGTVTQTGNAGNLPTVDGIIFNSFGMAASHAEFLCLAYTPNLPNWTAVRAAVTSKYGVSVAV